MNTQRMSKKRSKQLFYTVFSTAWGHFGLIGTDSTLIRTHLPLADCNRVVQRVTAGLGPARFNAGHMPALQQRIKAYYKGDPQDGSRHCADGLGHPLDSFSDIRVNLHEMTAFTSAVLRACRKIKPGQTVTYAQLAKMAGQPKAVRAVGTALARNPLPLIIPCHRVIRSDGRLGGFSATGGQAVKKQMLNLERAVMK